MTSGVKASLSSWITSSPADDRQATMPAAPSAQMQTALPRADRFRRPQTSTPKQMVVMADHVGQERQPGLVIEGKLRSHGDWGVEESDVGLSQA